MYITLLILMQMLGDVLHYLTSISKFVKSKIMSKLSIKPFGDRVLVEPISGENDKKKSTIIIPETVDKERPEQGKVVAVGDGWYNEDGELVPLRLKKGQVVLFAKYGPEEIKHEGKEYFIIKESNILAVIETSK